MARKTKVDVQQTVRDGLSDAASTARAQIAGLLAYQCGKPQSKDLKRVLGVDQAHLLLTYTKILSTLADEERKQVEANAHLFTGMSDAEVAALAVQARAFLKSPAK